MTDDWYLPPTQYAGKIELFFAVSVAAHELVYAASCVNQLGFASVERV